MKKEKLRKLITSLEDRIVSLVRLKESIESKYLTSPLYPERDAYYYCELPLG